MLKDSTPPDLYGAVASNSALTIVGTVELLIGINIDGGVHVGGGTAHKLTGNYTTQPKFSATLTPSKDWNWQDVIGQPTNINLTGIASTEIQVTIEFGTAYITGQTDPGSYKGPAFNALGSTFIWIK